MKKFALLIPTLALVVSALSGCSKSGSPLAPTPGPGGTRSAQIQSAVTSEAAKQPQFVEDGFYESPDPMTLGTDGAPTGPLSVQQAITPVTFWRTIRHVDRDFQFAFSDTDSTGLPTRAILTIHKFMTGFFNVQVADSSFNRVIVHKPLADDWLRRLLFIREHRADEPDDETVGEGSGDDEIGFWRLAAVSGIKITSKDHKTEIVSLQLQGAGLDTTITHPLEFFRVRHLLTVDPSAEITITATTMAPDDIVLLLSRDHRFRLKPNGDNTYTGTFKVPFMLGVFHFGVNALSHGTLYDDQAPYDSQTWILPYMVRGTTLASSMP